MRHLRHIAAITITLLAGLNLHAQSVREIIPTSAPRDIRASAALAQTVTGLVPAQAPAGARVLLTGNGLDAADLSVVFPGAIAPASVISSSADRLELVVPTDATTGTVQVMSGTAIIGTAPFTLTPPPSYAKVVTLIGGPSAGEVMKEPFSCVVLPDGRIVVADTFHHQVRVVTPTGQVSVLAGNLSSGYADGTGAGARFKEPRGIAWDAATNVLFVADTGNNAIRKVTLDGVVTTLAGTTSSGSQDGTGSKARFKEPRGIAVGHSGTLFVADTGNNRIRVVTSGGGVSTLAGTSQGHRDGVLSHARFNEPAALVARDGVLFVADTGNHVIRKIEDGQVTTIAGSPGQSGFKNGTGSTARFSKPAGIDLDEFGSLVIADTENSLVRKLHLVSGSVSTLAGTGDDDFRDGAPLTAKFKEPTGISVRGFVSVTDSKNYAVRRIVPELRGTAIWPGSGSSEGGDSIRVFGTGFLPGATTVSIGATSVPVEWISSTQIIVTAPAGTGSSDLTVTTLAGSVVLSNAWSWAEPFGSLAIDPNTASLLIGETRQLQATATRLDGTAVNVTSTASWVSSSVSIASVAGGLVTAHAAGTVTITANAEGLTVDASVTVNEAPPEFVSLAVEPAAATIQPGQSMQFAAWGFRADGSSANLTSGAEWSSSNTSVASVAAGLTTAHMIGSATIHVAYQGLTASASVLVTDQVLPPDPALIAPPIDPTRIAPPDEQYEFLYEGPDPVQTGVAPGAIDPSRASVVRGRVLTEGLEPLPGAKITVLGAPQLGQTFSRTDGMYDLVVNGGGSVSIVVAKDGYLSIHRQVETRWNDFHVADDVVMTRLSTAVTRVALNPTTSHQVVVGATSGDASGNRTPRLLFSPGTTGTMTLADGSSQPLSELSVRATEYTVGESGPLAMPASLPPQSAYTYCVELNGDEAQAAGATRVDFSAPVRYYLDNFLGFPVGSGVPVGSYDRTRGVWEAESDGLVIGVFPSSGGEANVDTDGDGTPDSVATLDAMGIDAAERQFLAAYYPAGLSLWRVSVTHFTPFDLNWAAMLPLDAIDPKTGLPRGAKFERDANTQCGSIIDCQNQALGEQLPINGTAFSLSYRSDRVLGRTADYTLRTPLTGASYPASLKRIDLEIKVAGRIVRRSFTPAANLEDTFVWDGLDAYGRRVQGLQPATVRLGYVYDAEYALAGTGPAFARVSFLPSGIPARSELTQWRESQVSLGLWDASGLKLGGWSVDEHHVYDPVGGTVYLGDGGRIAAPSTIGTWVGTGVSGYTGDGGSSQVATLADPQGLATDASGNLYIADNGNGAIRKVTKRGMISTIASGIDGPSSVAVAPDGRIHFATFRQVFRIERDGTTTTIAGTGATGFSGDGGPATEASFSEISSIAFGPDGALYLNENSEHRILRIDPSGILYTIAGTGQAGYSGDNLPATESRLDTPEAIAVDAKGNVYVAVLDPIVVRVVTPGGRLRTVAGSPDIWDELDGVVANETGIGFPYALATGAQGDLFIGTNFSNRLRRVNTSGVISTVAGTGENSYGGDAGPPTLAQLRNTTGLAVDKEGTIYVAGNDHRIRRITTLRGETTVPSRDGSLLHVFDATPKHVRTVDAYTSATLLEFAYDSAGRLVSIRDIDGNVTVIERDAAGEPVAIVAPFGQRTTLTTGSNGYLTRALDPAGHSQDFTYSGTGLMQTYTDARGGLHEFSFSSDGRLRRDDDAADGFTTLSRTENADGYTVATQSALGRRTTYDVVTHDTGALTRVMTNPAGLATTTEIATSELRTVQLPDGTLLETQLGPDPRFGMASPVIANLSVMTPGGLELTASQTSTAIFTDSSDPTTLASATSAVTVNGKTFTSVFNAATRQITTTSPRGRRTITSLDAANNVSFVEVPGLAATSFSYSPRGLLESATRGTRTMTLTHNAEGLIDGIQDPLNRTLGFDYDAAGRVTRQTLPGGQVIDFEYDENGNLTSLAPPGRSAHIFTYTTRDEISSYEPPALPTGGTNTVYSFDADRKLTRIVRPDGTSAQFVYDAAFRLETLSHSMGLLGFRYDGAGRLAGLDNGSETLDYAWDGSLLTRATASGTVNGSIGYVWDNDLRVISTTVNGGSAINSAYDTDGLLTGVGAMSITRDPNHGLVTATALGVVRDTYTHNEHGEVATYHATVSGAPIYAVVYTRDNGGRITAKRETIQGVTTVYEYLYDTLGRLRDVLIDGVQTSHYEYDPNGNRTLRISAFGTETALCDGQDRVIGFGDATFSYTPNGELLTKTDPSGTTTYTYDALGALTKAVLPDGKVLEYVIDGQSRRIGKKVNGALSNGLLYDGQLSIAAELNASGTVVSRFASGMMIRGGVTYRILTDHLGSPRLVLNSTTGAVVQRLDFDEFGNVVADTNPGFQPFGFAGGLYDRDTKLVRFGARDYDAKTGRWTAKDPIGFGGGDSNLYGYVTSDPVNFRDPTGLTVSCKYAQSTGVMTCTDDSTKKEVVNETGYSGKGAKKNSAADQCVKNEGPIPRGKYTFGTSYDSTKVGKKAIPLDPDATNNMCSPTRDDFLVHGDNATNTASEGCIIMSLTTRTTIIDSGGGTLEVVEK